MEVYYVYILRSLQNASFYKGITNNLKRRVQEHNNGEENATKKYTPWELVWYCEKKNKSEAVVLERKLKNLSRKRLEQFIGKYNNDRS
jgi:putative endonuclease